MTERTGLFITLEGPDGAGKSLQAAVLAERLIAAGRRVLLTREPGGTPLGESIRRVVLEADDVRRDPLSEAFLFNAARRQLVAEVIGPGLAEGRIVVCDRFADSTLAYQGHGAGAPFDSLVALANAATGGLRPDRTVLLDLPVEDGLARRSGGDAAQLTRFEVAAEHDRDFHERVRRGYLALAAQERDRWRVVDASADQASVSENVWEAVVDLLVDG